MYTKLCWIRPIPPFLLCRNVTECLRLQGGTLSLLKETLNEALHKLCSCSCRGIPGILLCICFQSPQFFQENSLLVFLERFVLVLHLTKAVPELRLGLVATAAVLMGRSSSLFFARSRQGQTACAANTRQKVGLVGPRINPVALFITGSAHGSERNVCFQTMPWGK